MKRPRALDLFCGAGGAAMGLWRAGFDVVGIDIKPMPRYPFLFIRGDALRPPVRLGDFDLVWASPPCEHYSPLKSRMRRRTWDTVPATRSEINKSAMSGILSVMENVPGRHIRADVTLCGAMFGLSTYRHRVFELSFPVHPPLHPAHLAPAVTRRRSLRLADGAFVSITGDVGRHLGPKCMGIDWMNGEELSQAVPPAYSEHIGRYAMMALGLDPDSMKREWLGKEGE